MSSSIGSRNTPPIGPTPGRKRPAKLHHEQRPISRTAEQPPRNHENTKRFVFSWFRVLVADLATRGDEHADTKDPDCHCTHFSSSAPNARGRTGARGHCRGLPIVRV